MRGAASRQPLTGRSILFKVTHNLGVSFSAERRRATLALCCPLARQMAAVGDVVIAVTCSPSSPVRRGICGEERLVLGALLVDGTVGNAAWMYHGLAAPRWCVGRTDRVHTAAPVTQCRGTVLRSAAAELRRADAARTPRCAVLAAPTPAACRLSARRRGT